MMWHPPLRLLNPKKGGVGRGGGGGGGGGEGGISCEMDKGDRSGRGSVYVSALKATMFAP